MGAAQRLGDDVVDHAQVLQRPAGQLQGLGGLAGEVVAPPEDGGAALRADHRVVGVLQDGDAVAHADAQRPAAAALADHHADDRRRQPATSPIRFDGDDLGLAALLGPDARIGARACR